MGLRKSTKKLFVFLFSSTVFFLILPQLASISNSINILKQPFVDLIDSQILSKIEMFDKTFFSNEELINYLKDQKKESLFMGLIKKIANADFQNETLSNLLAEYLYKLAVFAILSVVTFLIISIIIKFVYSFFFKCERGFEGLAVTKRFIGGIFGLLKGVVLFAVIVNILNISINLLGVEEIATNQLFSFGDGYYKNISAMLSGYV